jgi:hypothetical protein
MVPITVRLAAAVCDDDGGGFGCAPGGAVIGRFRITVEVLPSLDSLVPLALRAIRVAGLDEDCGWGLTAAVTVAPRFLPDAVIVVVVVVVVLVPAVVVVDVVEAVILRADAVTPVAVAGRVVDRAPSTILLRMLLASAARPGVTAGRARPDLAGVPIVRGAIRELDVVGDRTWPGLRAMDDTVLARIFFWGVKTSFSLSPPESS